MGDVKTVLATKDFMDAYFEDALRLEVSEAVHLHWRDTRILLTPDQFKTFYNCLLRGYNVWDGGLADQDTVLHECVLPNGILLEPVVSLEEQENGCIHFHYKDIRVEINQSNFVNMALLFEEAKVNYFKEREQSIAIVEINPYDHIHKPTFEEWVAVEGYSREHLVKDWDDHVDGILWMEHFIRAGFEINPILVTELSDGRYQRRDGYKRLMAYKGLGRTHIPCYVVSEQVALTMPQNKQFPFKGYADGV